MSGIPVSNNTIPLMTQDKTKPTNSPGQKQPAQKFQDILAEAARLEQQQSVPPAPEPQSADRNYTIQPGDTLSDIVAAESNRLGLNHSRRDLYNMVNKTAGLNKLTNPDTIFPGQKINLSSISQPLAASTLGPLTGLPSDAALAHSALTNKAELLPTTKLQSPISGRITSAFGRRHHPILGKELHHNGIDISQPTGTHVKPLTAGIVTFSGEKGGYGQMVEIDHGNGLSSRYAHLSQLLVRQGDRIRPEQTIGHVGETGLTTGPHLHLEIHRHNQPIDPLTVLHRQQIEDHMMLAEAKTSLPLPNY